jgi:hypothetical protein
MPGHTAGHVPVENEGFLGRWVGELMENVPHTFINNGLGWLHFPAPRCAPNPAHVNVSECERRDRNIAKLDTRICT